MDVLPPTFFANLAEKTPLVVFENRLYQVSEFGDSKDHIYFGEQRFGLEKSDDLFDLESFYRYKNAAHLFAFKKAFIEAKLKESIFDTLKIKEIAENLKILCFILYDVFPYFNGDDNIDNLLAGQEDEIERKQLILDMEGILNEAYDGLNSKRLVKTKAHKVSPKEFISLTTGNGDFEESEEEDGIDELLAEHYSSVDEMEVGFFSNRKVENQSFSRSSGPRTLLSVALDGNNVLTFYDRVYTFSDEKKDPNVKIVIKGQEYTVNPSKTVKEIDEKYRNLLERQLKKEAEKNFEYETFLNKKVQEIDQELGEFIKMQEYEDREVGFIKKENGYYVTLKVPPYVLKEVKDVEKNFDQLYLLDTCKVCLKLDYENGQLSYEVPRVVERYKSPFVSDSDNSFQTICLGNYSRGHLSSLDDAGKVASLLSDARKVLESGYTMNCGPFHRVSKLNLKKISLKEVGKSKLRITNV